MKLGLFFVTVLAIITALIFYISPSSAYVNPGEIVGYNYCDGLCPAWVNLTRGDMLFTDGSQVFIIVNYSCNQTSVCNESMTVTGNFSEIGGSSNIVGVFKQNATDGRWAVFELNDTVNFSNCLDAPFLLAGEMINLNATDGNTSTGLYNDELGAMVVLVNLSYPPGCPPPDVLANISQISLLNGTDVNVGDCWTNCSVEDTAQYMNSTHYAMCGPAFGGDTTNFTTLADTGNFSNFNFIIEIPEKVKVNFTQNVSSDASIFEFVRNVMVGPKFGINDTEWNGIIRPNLNLSAIITFYNVSKRFGFQGRPQIFRYAHREISGASCPPSICSNFIWDGENITFTVSSFSDYGLTDVINVTLQTPSNLSYVNTSNINFTYIPEWNSSVTMKNCTLYGNFTGSWLANQTNQSALVNGGVNWIIINVTSGVYLWNIYCFDNTSQYDYYSPNWTVNVTVYPTYSNNRTSTNVVGQPVNFTLDWLDNDGLTGYNFSTNNSGSWVNSSYISFSGKTNTSWNVTTLNSTNGTIVAWCYYANDTNGRWNSTSCQSGNQFLLTALEQLPSTYSDNSTNTTIAGVATSFRLKWSDPNGLSGYIFSIDNCTGTFSTSSWMPMTELTNWSNVTYVTNSTGGCTIRWNVSANDTVNNWTATNIMNFTVKLVDGSACTIGSQCYNEYCVHNSCWYQSTHCGDGYCDTGESCTLDNSACSSGYACTNGCVATSTGTQSGSGISGSTTGNIYVRLAKGSVNITSTSITTSGKMITTIARYEDVAIRGMNITVINNVANIKITITKLSLLPSTIPFDVPGMVYHYINIEKINMTDSDINVVNFEFAVNKTWLTNNNVSASNITLYRWNNNQWDDLNATKINESTQEAFYNANSRGLSVFVIGAKGAYVAPPPQPTCVENWQCTEWTSCVNKITTRACNDLNNCGTTSNKPSESKACEPGVASTSPIIVPILTYVIVVVAVVIVSVLIFLERVKITFYLQELYKKVKKKEKEEDKKKITVTVSK